MRLPTTFSDPMNSSTDSVRLPHPACHIRRTPGWRCLLLAVLTSLTTTLLANPQTASLIAYSAGMADVAVSQDGAPDILSFSTAVWGPSWGWTGIEGKAAGSNGITTATLASRVDGKPLSLGFAAKQSAANKLDLSYDLAAEAEARLTLYVVTIHFGKTFEKGGLQVTDGGAVKTVAFPLNKGSLGQTISTLKVTDSAGRTASVSLSPPCEIAVDGWLRLILAKDRITPGIRHLSLTVELPSDTQWYPNIEDIPQEPGIASWYPWQGTGLVDGSLTDMRYWIERPAGKSGRIARQGDALIYNQKPIKLWGINLCYGGCSPEKALAEKRAVFYTSFGINAVRLHKFADNAGWAGIQSKDSAVDYDAAGLDRMDYQVAKFKEAGIYIDLSAHFGTLKLGPGDKPMVPFLEEFGSFREGRVELPHSAVYYAPELQQVQIQQMLNLLKHRNPYTGLTYAEDPAIAFLEIINEQSILFYSSSEPLKASVTLRQKVGTRFCQWLREKYGSQEKLAQAWGNEAFDCFTKDGFAAVGENLDKNNILPIGNPWYWDPEQLRGSQAPKRQRLLDTLEFLYGLESEFYARYTKAVRDAGYAGELIGSNWQAGRGYSHFANLHADALVGTVDRHNYFSGDHANATMLARAGSGILSSGMQQVAGHPFMMSEWIHEYPCEYTLEGPAIIGAYGMGLQGWDASFIFENADNASFSDRIGRDRWDVTAPQLLGAFSAISRQILRGDVKTSDVVAVRKVHVPSLFQGKLGFEDKVVQGYDTKELDSTKVPARALAAARSVVEFTDSHQETPVFDMKAYEQGDGIRSSTGQLFWSETNAPIGGKFTMKTPGTCAVIGFAAGQKCDLGAVSIEPRTRFSAIYVTARNPNETIENARELLIVAMARARNTGMKFSPDGARLLAQGTAPIVMEPVTALLTLKKTGTPKVLLLDHNGKPTGATLPVDNGKILLDGTRDKTPYYLIQY